MLDFLLRNMKPPIQTDWLTSLNFILIVYSIELIVIGISSENNEHATFMLASNEKERRPIGEYLKLISNSLIR